MNDGRCEQHLVEQAVAGDNVALKALLLSRHDALVCHVEQRLPADLRGELSGEDICQEAYVVIFQEVTSLRVAEVRVFESWLYTVIENKLKDTIRARRAAKRGGHRRNVADASAVAELIEDASTPSRSAAKRENAQLVRAVLSQLPQDYREALRLHYLEHLTVGETAVRLGRTEGAVSMLCKRALRRAAELLGDSAQFLSRKT